MFRAVVAAALLAAPGALSAQAGAAAVPRTIYIQTMDQEFGKMDADKNGKVTRVEVEAFQRSAAVAQAGARARALFAQLDADRNGQLSPAEFAKGVNATGPVNGQPLVAQLDTNRDGAISLVEHRAGKLAHFDRIDLDKDGVVSAAEMKSAGVIK
jgi:Ca2+-binding EF-hand superfamily protein